jgi:hypothetical protein
MKIRSLILGATVVGCATGVTFPPRSAAVVSDEDFNALKNQVQQLNGNVENLKQEHTQDQQTIQQLEQRLGETQTLATNAVQKADAAQLQSTRPVANGGPSATHHILMGGDAEVQFGKANGQHSAFVMADFAPIFLYRANDNILFEAGFDVTLQNGTTDGVNNSGATTTVGLSFAQLDYLFNDYVTLVAGYDLLPLGTYSERSAGWLNKMPDSPMARDLLPGAGVGMQLRGAVPIGQKGQSLTYAVYGVNGPSSVDGTGRAMTTDLNGNTMPNLDLGGNIGIRSDGAQANLHGNPSAGGRIGWFFPWKPHYDLELGVSGQSGEWDNAGRHLWSAAVLDAALHISPYFEIKGEYINTWYETDDMGTLNPNGLWVQAGYKLAGFGLELPIINDIELVGRYDNMNDGLGTKTDRGTVGFVYYITNTLLFEGDYEFLHSRGPAAVPSNQLILQLSYGF